ncbi:FAD-dependent oxidoreductase [Termitidicoccus mucosus]|uniref:NADH:ubiquinone reductase (non-electrogenic) n=1 Tax=Termitidicoccus mucosus TaxID=1184151 RepID=A0A178IHD2_9BACT|nr:copper transporter [Opitutaceae bacterium TSB47]
MKYDVVIAGGGFAGAYCAKVLGRALGREGVRRVALIAESNVLVFQPMLAEVAGSALLSYDVVNPLRQFCRNVDVLQGVIERVDWAARRLSLNGGRFTRDHMVEFRHLVLALGSVTDLGKVPGMADYGWPMRTVSDALRLRSAVINRLEEANLVEDETVRARLLTFVVVGGGYTGVETAGQLLDFLREVRALYANLREARVRVVLVHSRAHLLEEIGQKLGDYAQRVLEKRGMEVRLNSRVTEVTAGRVMLETGRFIEAHTIISTVGNAPNPVVLDVCRQIAVEAVKGRVPVEPVMRVAGQRNLWVIGDCAQVPWTDRGEVKIAPPTAQFAVRQGKQLGENLARVLRAEDGARRASAGNEKADTAPLFPAAPGGAAPAGAKLRPFSYRYMGQLATVGEREAVAEVFGFRFSGFFAWWLWRTIYIAKLPSIVKRLRVTVDWTFDFFFPRDVSVVAPPPEDVVRTVHVSEGEALFERGNKARAYFIVRQGSVTMTDAANARELLEAGSVIDGDWVSPDGNWRATAVTNETTDLLILRGKAMEMLRHDLKLVRRGPDAARHHGFQG